MKKTNKIFKSMLIVLSGVTILLQSFAPISVMGATIKTWSLTKASYNGSQFTIQPILTIDGVAYKYTTPQEYLTKLNEIKLAGATGAIDGQIAAYKLMQSSQTNGTPIVSASLLAPLVTCYEDIVGESVYDDVDYHKILFKDITKDTYKSEIITLLNYKIIQGRNKSTGMYSPKSYATQAEFFKVLIKLLFRKDGISGFKGESSNNPWYKTYLEKAKALGFLDKTYNTSNLVDPGKNSVSKKVAMSLICAGLEEQGDGNVCSQTMKDSIPTFKGNLSRSEMAKLFVSYFRLNQDKSWMIRSNNYELISVVESIIGSYTNASQKANISKLITGLQKYNKTDIEKMTYNSDIYYVYVPLLISQLQEIYNGTFVCNYKMSAEDVDGLVYDSSTVKGSAESDTADTSTDIVIDSIDNTTTDSAATDGTTTTDTSVDEFNFDFGDLSF